MRYREILFEEAAEDRLFFHVTTDRRVPLILQNGVEPNHRRRWRGMHGKQLGERGYIYLISDFTAAVKWAARVVWEMRKGKRNVPVSIVALGAVPDHLELDPNPDGQLTYGKTWFQMRGAVPASKIVRVVPLTPELVKRVIERGAESKD